MSVLPTGYDAEQIAPPHLETAPIHFRAILAATDLSEQATTALKIAAQAAHHFRSRLQVVYAVMPEFYMADTTVLSPELQKVDLERAQHELHEYTRRIPEVRTTMHEEIAVFGPAVDVIEALARTAGIDLLVMGSHGHGAARKLVLGSVAESVIRNTHCPVLVAGPHCKPRLLPLKSIVLATNLPAASLRAAQYATSLTRQFGGTLTVVHVLRGDAGEGTISSASTRRELRELVPDDPELKHHVHFQVRSGEAAQEVVRIAKRSKADLIVMGAHEHSTLADHSPWATLSHVIRESPCPVLAVQPHFA